MARKGFSGAVFCGCSTLRDGARAEGTGHVKECQAMWSHEHIHKHSSELCPSQNCSHEIFRLLDAAHPLLSPSASTLPLHHLWLPPPPPRCGEGKIRSQTRGGSVPTLWARGTGSKLDLPHNTPHTGKESESRN